MHKQTVCKVLNIFQHGKYLVAYQKKIYEKSVNATFLHLLKLIIWSFDHVNID